MHFCDITTAVCCVPERDPSDIGAGSRSSRNEIHFSIPRREIVIVSVFAAGNAGRRAFYEWLIVGAGLRLVRLLKIVTRPKKAKKLI